MIHDNCIQCKWKTKHLNLPLSPCDVITPLLEKQTEKTYQSIVDENQSPCELWRHRLRSVIESDELVFEEKDGTFTLYVTKTKVKSGSFMILTSKIEHKK
ncbi:hypothetical protein GCM10011384_40970 [Psychrobacillus lasiicapitis]|nr:hypothetical protein GCM10011384_40970 [Psychrobacillus lasiicapitis]